VPIPVALGTQMDLKRVLKISGFEKLREKFVRNSSPHFRGS